MRASPIYLALAFLAGQSVADAQTVIVPETTYSAAPTSLKVHSTSMLDHDSVFMAFTDHTTFLGGARFQVVHIDTGAIELGPVPLPDGMGNASVAVLSPDSGLVVVRDNNDGGKGKYFVVNPLTGTIVRGPVTFSSGPWEEFRIAVIDSSTVLISVLNTFIVVDPHAATVKVPETSFAPGLTTTVEVAALDATRVAIAYSTPAPNELLFFTVVNPQDGQIVRPPVPVGVGPVLGLTARNLTDVLLVYYDTSTESHGFATLDTVTGARSLQTPIPRVGYNLGLTMVGAHSLFLGFAPDIAAGQYTLYDIDGPQLVPPTPFNPEGPTYDVSAVSSGCRVLVSYSDVPDSQKGKFQVFDFSDVCVPAVCPPDITDAVDIFRSPFAPFYLPALQLQLVLVRNRTPQAIQGPLSLVLEDLRNGLVFGAGVVSCKATPRAPSVRLGAGADNVLSPGDVGGAFLLFASTTADPITYRPRVIHGVARR